jgi:hypothetical protein
MTDEYRVLLLTCWREGWTWKRLINRYRRANSAAIRAVIVASGHRLDEIPPPAAQRAFSAEVQAQGEAMIAAGCSLSEAARALGVQAKTLGRYIRGDERKKAAIREKPATTRRACLTCDRPFDSEGKHNRVCKSCKETGPFHGLGAMATAGVRAG